jgi:hypothetical protein
VSIPASINGIPVTSIADNVVISAKKITIPADISIVTNSSFFDASLRREFIDVYEHYGQKAGTFARVGNTYVLLSSEEIEEALARGTPASDFTIVQTADGVVISG